MNLKQRAIALAAVVLLAGVQTGLAQSSIQLIVPGPADWNDSANWDVGVVPGGPAGELFPQEVVGISNSGVAFLDAAALFTVDGVILGEDQVGDQLGTLEIRDGGSLLVQAGGGGPLAGAVLVGQGGGTGILDMLGGGSLNADSLDVQGAGGSTLRLGGNASLQTTGNVTLGRNATLSGPGVTFEVGEELTVSGNFGYEITAAADSTISAPFANANLAGVLTVTLNGYTPAMGDSWTMIDAAGLSGNFAVVEVPAATTGLGFDLTQDAAAGDVIVSVGNRLVLSVNRATGAVQIDNIFGNTDMKGYTISSTAGRLDRDAWNSLDDQMVDGNRWFEANPTENNLSELNLEGMSSLGAGGSLAIGNPYNFTPAAFGDTVTEDLTFKYATDEGQTKTGSVVFEGDVRTNNLVLTVDPATGQAEISNPSFFEVDVNGYIISSPSGSLDVDGWNSFDDQGLAGDLWFEANPTSDNLSELSLEGMTTLAIGSQFLIGSPLTAGGMQDLTFQFNRVGFGPMFGIVEYGPLSVGLNGDTNDDGVVNIDDLNNVRNNFGAMGDPDGSLPGDAFPFDGLVNIDDLNGVRNNFGAMLPAAVPEPSGILLCSLGLVGILNAVRRRGRSSL